MTDPRWTGVYPAITTQFRADESLDVAATCRHVEHLLAAGVHGVIALGSLGENVTLEPEEKLELVRAVAGTVAGRVPVLAGVAETSTRRACQFAESALAAGATGLMVLPAMVYKSDPRETMHHFRTVAKAAPGPIMIYNNPVSYGVDLRPEHLAELADVPQFVAVKESSDNVRRVTDLRLSVGERYRIFCGVDDLALESAMLGAVGWVAGLVNAFPRETVRLWELAQAGRFAEAVPLYRWFTPLLHLDTEVKLV
ncbi:MAG TPA: dihydrodipicolinate synthase family protein [Gemmatales bacterium]|nr:dihydrodipicolinate synthase family protein [Gemmatales bacterium]